MPDLMTFEDYRSLLEGEHGKYYEGRWKYFKEVIKIVETLKIDKVLEMGPGFMPVVKDADLMLSPSEDQFGRPETKKAKIIYHDATVKPWPVKDKEYDLFIALQVWEHLDNKQCRAFREVMRIAKKAVLSFPYLWDGGEDNWMHRAHRNIDRDLICDWTLNVPPERIIEIKRTGGDFNKGPRLIYFWNFD